MKQDRLDEALEMAYEELKHATSEEQKQDIQDRIEQLEKIARDHDKIDIERLRVENDKYKTDTDQELKGEEIDKTNKREFWKIMAELGLGIISVGTWVAAVGKCYKLEINDESLTSKTFTEVRHDRPRFKLFGK